MQYSQALRFNRIYSNNEIFDKRCNDIEKYLLERGYSEKMVRQEILRTSAIKVNNHEKQDKITLPSTISGC